MSVLAIILGLVLLMVLTLKKIPVVISSLISVIFIAVFSGMDVMETLTGAYVEGLTGFIKSMFLIILLGAIFSKILETTGAANSIAKLVLNWLGVNRAILAIIITGAALTYGGVSNMVSCFALYPIALDMFRKANLPRYLMPATICAGLFTWVCVLPGAPTVGNLVASQYLGTSTTAGAGLGIFAAAIILVLTLLYLNMEVKKARKAGIGFVADESIDSALSKVDQMEKEGRLPNPVVSLIPLITLTIILIITDNAVIAEFVAVVLSIVLLHKNLGGWDKFWKDMESAVSSTSSIIITASSIVAIGTVVKSAPGFQTIVDFIISFTNAGGNALLIFGIATTLLCGLNASGSGGLATTLSAMSETFLNMGIDPSLLHRIGVIASVGLDSLPHSGGVVAIHQIVGVSYKDGYKYVFVTTCVITLFALCVTALIANML
jgi:H+/gluconate symporter-like permease